MFVFLGRPSNIAEQLPIKAAITEALILPMMPALLAFLLAMMQTMREAQLPELYRLWLLLFGGSLLSLGRLKDELECLT